MIEDFFTPSLCRRQCGGLAGYCGVEEPRDFPCYKPSSLRTW